MEREGKQQAISINLKVNEIREELDSRSINTTKDEMEGILKDGSPACTSMYPHFYS